MVINFSHSVWSRTGSVTSCAGDWKAPLLVCLENVPIKHEVASSLLEHHWLSVWKAPYLRL